MDIDPGDNKTWIATAIAAIFSFVSWLGSRQVKQWDGKITDHEAEIGALKQTVATKEDVTAIRERLTEVSDKMSDNHAKILEILVKKQ